MKLNPLSWWTPADEQADPQDATEEYSMSDDAVLQAFLGAVHQMSAAGIRVTQETALRSTAVLGCLIVRSETFSSLPVHVLQQQGKAQVHLPEDPAYRLLAIAPNPLMTAKEFWRWKQLNEDIRGNAWARVEWDRKLRPTAIWPLYGPKPRLTIDKTTRRCAWQYQGDDFTPADAYPLEDILHFKGPVLVSPFEARSLIDLAAETIGVSVGSEQFFARLLGNGSHFPGYLETDNDLQPDDVKAINDQMAGFAGIIQAGTIRIFDRGLKYKQNPMSLKDAELTEQQRWYLQGICSVFRVQMAMVQDLSTGTYANSEQQDLWLGKHTVTPICTNTEAVCRMRLFARPPLERFAKWNLDGLLRGDYKTRTEGDATLVRAGIINRDTARSHYDLNPEPGLDKYLAELNLGVVGPDGTITGPDQGSQQVRVADQLADAAAAVLEPMVTDALACIRRRFTADRHQGRPKDETIAFAATKLAPLAEAHQRAGLVFDPVALVAQAAAGDTAATLDETQGAEA